MGIYIKIGGQNLFNKTKYERACNQVGVDHAKKPKEVLKAYEQVGGYMETDPDFVVKKKKKKALPKTVKKAVKKGKKSKK